MNRDDRPPMVAPGWPGVFRPLLHDVAPNAKCIVVRGARIYFAKCNAPCVTRYGRAPAVYQFCPICRDL